MNGYFSDKALSQYSELLRAAQEFAFSEGSEFYDFTRCVRPDGTAYGTGGKCRKGAEEAKQQEDRERTREIVRAGGHAPINRPPETPSKIQKMKEDVARRAESRKKWEEERKAYQQMLQNAAEKLLQRSGNTSEGVRRDNQINSVKEDLHKLMSSGDKETQEMIRKGDIEGLIRKAHSKRDQNVAEVKKQARAEEAKAQKAILKDMLAANPQELHGRIKENHAYESKKETSRAAARAEDAHNAYYGIRRLIPEV